MTNLDDGDVDSALDLPGSLRQAVFDANTAAGADTIVFDAGLNPATATIRLTTVGSQTAGPSAFEITSDITIQGSGITIERDAGAVNMRLFYVNTTGTLSLENLTLRGGVAKGGNGVSGGGGAAGLGGAIFNRGTLVITESHLTGHAAVGGNGGGTGSFGGGGGLGGDGQFDGTGGGPNGGRFGGFDGGFGGGGGGDGGVNLGANGGMGGFGGGGGAPGGFSAGGGDGGDGGFGGGGGFAIQVTGQTRSHGKGGCAAGGGANGGAGGGAGLGGAIFSDHDAVTLTDTTLTGNSATGGMGGNRGQGLGGGVYIAGGTLTVTGSTISNNTAADTGGGLQVAFFTRANITDSTVTGNTAGDSGGGFANRGTATFTRTTISNNTAVVNGGGFFSTRDVTVIDSTISGNTANNDGGGFLIFSAGSTANVSGSTISGNRATNRFGGGFRSQDASTVSLTNSTISTNSAHIGGGVQIGSSSTVIASNTTIANNVTALGAGGIDNDGNVELSSSIVAGNRQDTTPNDIATTVGRSTTADFSLVQTAPTGPFAGSNNLTEQDPLLGPLRNNGGLTRTHALLPGSPAIDAGRSGMLVKPTNVTSSLSGTDTFPADNLIDGSGLSTTPTFDNVTSVTHADASDTTAWVTSANGTDYFDSGITPLLTFQFSERQPISDIVVWGYHFGAPNNNEAAALDVLFSSDGDSTTSHAVSVTHARTAQAAEVISLGRVFVANTVSVFVRDNHFGAGGGGGGDRVGLGEVRFLRSSPTTDQRGASRPVGAAIDMGAVEYQNRPDYGDAPDTGAGTGRGNYETLSANGGPQHTLFAGLRLGPFVDGDDGTLQNATANADDVSGAVVDDEDGVLNPLELRGTIGAAPTVTLLATNTTGNAATLSGWIDYNQNGVFDNATERAQVSVPDGTTDGRVTLTFPTIPSDTAGETYARFRLSTDAAAENSTGAASDGEVEDYTFSITAPSTGTVDSFLKIADGSGGLPVGTLADVDSFGIAVTSLGDLDGDGVADLAVGAYADNTGGVVRGAVHVLLLKSDGAVKSSTKIASGLNGGPTLADGDFFGASVTSVGDLDGDGVPDLAVGAERDATSGVGRGAVHVLLLNNDGSVKSSTKIASGLNGGPTLENGDFFGSSVSSVGDLDGDGVPDLAVGAKRDVTGGVAGGAVHVLLLNNDGSVKSSTKIASGLNGGPTLRNDDIFGSSVTSVGDLNGDGVPDLAVGAFLDDTNGTDRGAVHILFLDELDITPPVLQSILRQNPATVLTEADKLTFRVTFNEAVTNVNVADFAVNGSTSAAVTEVSSADSDAGLLWDVAVSGGDLATFRGRVNLDLASGQDVTDAIGNALPDGEPAMDESYHVFEGLGGVTSFIVDVASHVDDGDFQAGELSLPEAILLTEGNAGADTITFDPVVFGTPQTIKPQAGEFRITDELTIIGPGRDLLTISASASSRIFNINDGDNGNLNNVTIEGLTLTDGHATGGGEANQGGAIYSIENLTLRNSRVQNSVAADSGGGLALRGPGTIVNSTISGNTAVLNGGGFFSSNAVTVIDSTISGNHADNDGGGFLIFADGSTATVIGSTISGNMAPNNFGGGFRSQNASIVRLTNTTISTNTARIGGGLQVASSSTVIATNTTIANNVNVTEQGGGGIDNDGNVELTNTLVAGNRQAFTPSDIITGGSASATVNFSLIQTAAGGPFSGSGNVIGQDPLLGVLQHNGGLTQTHTLAANSPAIDVGNNALALDSERTALTSDQRLAPFGRIVDGGSGVATVDIGAFEVQALSVVVTTAMDELDFTNNAVSLREAIDAANANPGADTITFDASINGQAINLDASLGQLEIVDTVTIIGNGPANTVIDAGQQDFRVFNITSIADVTFEAVTIAGGNLASGNGGGIHFGSSGSLTVRDSTITGNTAVAFGGGLYVGQFGTVLLENSTLADNSAGFGGGVFSSGSLTAVNSTVSGNSADGGGGMLNHNFGSTATLTLTNSTITGNTADSSGGGGLRISDTTILNNTIVAGNRLTNGTDNDIENSGTLTGQHNLIGDPNSAGDLTHDSDGTGDGNVVGNGSGSALDINSILQPLAFNGGPTQTHALVAGSPAIDAGLDLASQGITTDQRGFSRPQGLAFDIGAYEVFLDSGDAPDTGAGTGAGNYETLAANGGPQHTIVTGLHLGVSVDADDGALQNDRADADDVDGALTDDEDGVLNPLDLRATTGTTPTVTLLATNTTGSEATLFGWIDYNQDGVFDKPTERSQIAVADGTINGRFTLTFPAIPSDVAGETYVRFRLSTDAAAASSIGAASDGEVEDYTFSITAPSSSTVDHSLKIADGINGLTADTLTNSDRFGNSVVSVGDLDGDGVADLAVGAYRDDTEGIDRGAVHVLLLNSDGTVKSSTKIAHGTSGGPTLANSDRFGSSVASVGDLDGDGVADLAVGAHGDDTNGYDRGAVHVLLLNTDGTVKRATKIAHETNGGPTLADFDIFGRAVAAVGDLDGDGVADLAVGATGDGSSRGAVHVLLLNSDGTVKSLTKIAHETSGGPTLTVFDSFGRAVAAVGDLDGDGVADLAVGATGDDTGAAYSNRGAVHVLLLNSDGTVKSSTKIAHETSGGPTLADFDSFGSSVASVGDLDGDGVADLAIGASDDDTRGDRRGAVHVLFLGAAFTDLRATSFDAVTDHVLTGHTDVTFTIRNDGPAPAGAFATHIVFSPNDVIGDGDDVVIAGTTKTFDGLLPNTQESRTVSVLLDREQLYAAAVASDPAAEAVGYVSQDVSRLFVVIDVNDKVSETDETNNAAINSGISSDNITYFPWDTDGNGTVTPLETLDAIRSVGTADMKNDFDGNGIVTPLEALSTLQRIGYQRNTAIVDAAALGIVDPAGKALLQPQLASSPRTGAWFVEEDKDADGLFAVTEETVDASVIHGDQDRGPADAVFADSVDWLSVV